MSSPTQTTDKTSILYTRPSFPDAVDRALTQLYNAGFAPQTYGSFSWKRVLGGKKALLDDIDIHVHIDTKSKEQKITLTDRIKNDAGLPEGQWAKTNNSHQQTIQLYQVRISNNSEHYSLEFRPSPIENVKDEKDLGVLTIDCFYTKGPKFFISAFNDNADGDLQNRVLRLVAEDAEQAFRDDFIKLLRTIYVKASNPELNFHYYGDASDETNNKQNIHKAINAISTEDKSCLFKSIGAGKLKNRLIKYLCNSSPNTRIQFLDELVRFKLLEAFFPPLSSYDKNAIDWIKQFLKQDPRLDLFKLLAILVKAAEKSHGNQPLSDKDILSWGICEEKKEPAATAYDTRSDLEKIKTAFAALNDEALDSRTPSPQATPPLQPASPPVSPLSPIDTPPLSSSAQQSPALRPDRTPPLPPVLVARPEKLPALVTPPTTPNADKLWAKVADNHGETISGQAQQQARFHIATQSKQAGVDENLLQQPDDKDEQQKIDAATLAAAEAKRAEEAAKCAATEARKLAKKLKEKEQEARRKEREQQNALDKKEKQAKQNMARGITRLVEATQLAQEAQTASELKPEKQPTTKPKTHNTISFLALHKNTALKSHRSRNRRNEKQLHITTAETPQTSQPSPDPKEGVATKPKASPPALPPLPTDKKPSEDSYKKISQIVCEKTKPTGKHQAQACKTTYQQLHAGEVTIKNLEASLKYADYLCASTITVPQGIEIYHEIADLKITASSAEFTSKLASAQVNYGTICALLDQYSEAVKYFTIAAKNGHARAYVGAINNLVFSQVLPAKKNQINELDRMVWEQATQRYDQLHTEKQQIQIIAAALDVPGKLTLDDAHNGFLENYPKAKQMVRSGQIMLTPTAAPTTMFFDKKTEKTPTEQLSEMMRTKNNQITPHDFPDYKRLYRKFKEQDVAAEPHLIIAASNYAQALIIGPPYIEKSDVAQGLTIFKTLADRDGTTTSSQIKYATYCTVILNHQEALNYYTKAILHGEDSAVKNAILCLTLSQQTDQKIYTIDINIWDKATRRHKVLSSLPSIEKIPLSDQHFLTNYNNTKKLIDDEKITLTGKLQPTTKKVTIDEAKNKPPQTTEHKITAALTPAKARAITQDLESRLSKPHNKKLWIQDLKKYKTTYEEYNKLKSKIITPDNIGDLKEIAISLLTGSKKINLNIDVKAGLDLLQNIADQKPDHTDHTPSEFSRAIVIGQSSFAHYLAFLEIYDEAIKYATMAVHNGYSDAAKKAVQYLVQLQKTPVAPQPLPTLDHVVKEKATAIYKELMKCSKTTPADKLFISAYEHITKQEVTLSLLTATTTTTPK